MESFIKKIFSNQTNEQTHRQFVRFGKGDYKTRAVISFHKTTGIKLKSSFEYANEMIELALELSNSVEIEGIILSKEELSKDFSENNIKAIQETKKGGLFYENNIEKQQIESFKLKNIVSTSYFALLDIEGEGISLKIKKKLPKPGKSGEAKVDDKFCIMEADISKEKEIREAFFWDAFGKKIKAEHNYIINEIVMPSDEKDFEKMRLNAKRKGKLIRKLNIDGREEIKEIGFEA